MKPGFQKVNVANLGLASLWKLDLNLSKHLSILSIFYTAEKAFLNILFAINMASQHSYCKFHFFVAFLIFFCRSKMPKTPKMLMKKHGYWWIIHGNLKVILFFF